MISLFWIAICILLCSEVHCFHLVSSWSKMTAFERIKSGQSSSTQYLKYNSFNSKKETKLYGIPKLFRWMIDLYPLVLGSVDEGISKNEMTVDNFYLDMNGIIHTCTHSNNDKLVPLNEQEMFLRIFSYTDQLYKLVKPKKVMYLAIDGVAPRAKMNQQRSRRFRSSKEREALIADYISKEGSLPEDESFDSNCITPGTEFMYRLSLAFQKWIEYKMKTDKSYQNDVEIVFSGPDVPGEGEHKIMDYIREQQLKQNDDTNCSSSSTDDSSSSTATTTSTSHDTIDKTKRIKKERHCLYGLDADLIMLSLITHEPNFILLREKIITRMNNNGNQNKNRNTNIGSKSKSILEYSEEDFEVLEIATLRTMLKQHFRKLQYNISASSNSCSNNKDGTISSTSNNNQNPIKNPQSITDNIIKPIPWTVGFDLERIIDDFVFMCFFVGNDFLPCLPHMDIADGSLNYMMSIYIDILPSLGGYLIDKEAIHKSRVELFIQEIARREPLYFQQRGVEENIPEYMDSGYREYYYLTKFGIQPGDETSIRKLVTSYLEGLYWVLSYYHKGCQSWNWYYPYLYAPLASDLVNLASINVTFTKGKPFTPLLQLLSVLPPQSGSFLPSSYEDIMTNANSPLSPYYPLDFDIDANGKRNSWEYIVNIPFINEHLLMTTVNSIDHREELTPSERKRNLLGKIYTYKYDSSHHSSHNKDNHKENSHNSTGIDSTTTVTTSNSGSNKKTDLNNATNTGGKWGNALINKKPRH